jgi:hypothetical protein
MAGVRLVKADRPLTVKGILCLHGSKIHASFLIMTRKPTKRHEKIYLWRMSGDTFAEIGRKLGVSRARAQQLFIVARRRCGRLVIELPAESVKE